ncbi:MAG: 2-dehydropantoate 2-reductase N-terminal domain-containing protein [Alphaproteobacteria bacterium]
MRLIIYGAGGIGCVLGAELFERGHDVVLIARGAHLHAIQTTGLHYETPHRAVTLKVPAVGHPTEVDFRDGDVVLMTMKSQHTLDALEELYKVAGDRIPVISGQNGVRNEAMALRRFAHVYGMLVHLPADFLEPGIVLMHSLRTLGIMDMGCYPRGVDDCVVDVMAALTDIGCSAEPVAEIMRWKYAKLVFNLNNALAAVCPRGSNMGAIRDRLRREGQTVLAAAGIDYATEAEVDARHGDLLENGKIRGIGRSGTSTLQSLKRGNTDSEVDYINGEIVQLGRLHGIATPANLVLQRLANGLARGEGEPNAMPPDALSALIDRAAAEVTPQWFRRRDR